MSQDYAPPPMTDQEYEEAITQAIASTCHFIQGESKQFYSCLICGEKLTVKARELNERMLIHYHWMHLKRALKLARSS